MHRLVWLRRHAGPRGAVAELVEELRLASIGVIKSTGRYGRKEGDVGWRLEESVDDGRHEGCLVCLGLLCRLRKL